MFVQCKSMAPAIKPNTQNIIFEAHLYRKVFYSNAIMRFISYSPLRMM